MTKNKVPNPSRSLVEEILQGVSGFFQALTQELRSSSAQCQELAATQEELEELQGTVQGIVEQNIHDGQVLLETIQRLECLETLIVERLEALERSQQSQDREQVAQWKAALNRLRGLILILIGATGSALFQALVQDDLYPQLKERLKKMVDHIAQILKRLELPGSPLESTPQPTQSPTSTEEDADFHYRKGRLQQNKGDYECAIAEYSYRKGRFQQIEGDYDRAIAEYSYAIKLKPDYADAYARRAEVYLRRRHPNPPLADINRALADINRAIALKLALNRNDFVDIYLRGQIYELLGDKQSAIADYKKCLKLLWLDGGPLAIMQIGVIARLQKLGVSSDQARKEMGLQ